MSTDIRTEIVHHMARAFFASAWAEWSDLYGPGTPGMGVDILDVMPEELDPAAIRAANSLAKSLEGHHQKSLVQIFRLTVKASGDEGDRKKTPEMFGHYAAMEAMGHGVGLSDAFGHSAAEFVDVPYMEFGSWDLDSEKYPFPEAATEQGT